MDAAVADTIRKLVEYPGRKYCKHAAALLVIDRLVEDPDDDLVEALVNANDQQTLERLQQIQGMKTAGTITVEIPTVVSPDGQVSASLTINKMDNGGLKDITDVGVLYDHWWDNPNPVVSLVYVTAEIDLDEVFAERKVEGSVRVADEQPNSDGSFDS